MATVYPLCVCGGGGLDFKGLADSGDRPRHFGTEIFSAVFCRLMSLNLTILFENHTVSPQLKPSATKGFERFGISLPFLDLNVEIQLITRATTCITI